LRISQYKKKEKGHIPFSFVIWMLEDMQKILESNVDPNNTNRSHILNKIEDIFLTMLVRNYTNRLDTIRNYGFIIESIESKNPNLSEEYKKKSNSIKNNNDKKIIEDFFHRTIKKESDQDIKINYETLIKTAIYSAKTHKDLEKATSYCNKIAELCIKNKDIDSYTKMLKELSQKAPKLATAYIYSDPKLQKQAHTLGVLWQGKHFKEVAETVFKAYGKTSDITKNTSFKEKHSAKVKSTQQDKPSHKRIY